MKKVVILLSGGMDSATVLAAARAEGLDCYCLSFRYGQRHATELAAATTVAKAFGAREHKTIDIDLGAFGGSALTADIPIPKGRAPASGEIPVTYVPARNTVFLSYALAYLDVIGADAIYIGVNALDYSGYPDCRPDYIAAFEKMANLATRRGAESTIRIKAPLIHMTKAEIITAGVKLGVDYGQTTSCYDPDEAGLACGDCDACRLRKNGFAEAGVPDPTAYR